MRARNQTPIDDCVKEWTELIDAAAREEGAEEGEREGERDRTTFQTRSMFFFSWTITECRNAVAASQGMNAAFSTGSQAQ